MMDCVSKENLYIMYEKDVDDVVDGYGGYLYQKNEDGNMLIKEACDSKKYQLIR